MAKIIVTGLLGEQYLVDTNSKFETNSRTNTVHVTDEGNLHLRPIKESMEEIQRRINEVEAEATNSKLDEILENQKEMLTLLYMIQ